MLGSFRKQQQATKDAALAGEPNTPAAQFAHHLATSGKIAPGAVERAKRVAQESGEPLETVLSQLGLISDRELVEGLAAFLDVPLVSASDFPRHPILPEKLQPQFLKDRRLIPIADQAGVLMVAMANALDVYSADAVRFAAGRAVRRCCAYPSDIEAAFERLYPKSKDDGQQTTEHRLLAGSQDDLERLKDGASEAPVIRLVALLIAQAVELNASDIHIEPSANELRIRYRVDGVLRQVDSPPLHLASAVLSRIKVMAKLNIAERRLPQDGRIATAVRGRDVDIRVAISPTMNGERATLRILDRSQVALELESLGFDATVSAPLRSLVTRSNGILLVTGPTGSGKTTTLYAALGELNSVDANILTIEDPVEYQVAGVSQVQVKPQIGLTFAHALRSFLRQDPDVMMVGEIRDLETAQIAVQAALTGHLILSTVHTNDAASTITRLLDMGVEDYLITSTLNGIVAQRLVRALCAPCREAYQPHPELLQRLGVARGAENTRPLYRAAGCPSCSQTGYRGRTVIAEVLLMTDPLRQAVLRNADARELHRIAEEGGMQPLRQHGMQKAFAGLTSVEEVLRVTKVS